MKKNDALYEWDEETGVATCILIKNNIPYVGCATCSPNDEDMKSQKTGFHIAELRAQIKYLQQIKYDLRVRLSALNQLYYSMNRSKRFNEKSYENKMLSRQIHLTKEDLNLIYDLINEYKEEVKTYINDKDEFYKTIRRNREKDKNK